MAGQVSFAIPTVIGKSVFTTTITCSGPCNTYFDPTKAVPPIQPTPQRTIVTQPNIFTTSIISAYQRSVTSMAEPFFPAMLSERMTSLLYRRGHLWTALKGGTSPRMAPTPWELIPYQRMNSNLMALPTTLFPNQTAKDPIWQCTTMAAPMTPTRGRLPPTRPMSPMARTGGSLCSITSIRREFCNFLSEPPRIEGSRFDFVQQLIVFA